MRRIKTVSNLIEKAENKGFAKINGKYYGGQKMEKYAILYKISDLKGGLL